MSPTVSDEAKAETRILGHGVTRATDPLRIKARVVGVIGQHLATNGLTHAAAADTVRISRRKLSNILYGYFERVTEGQLFEMLTHLGYDIEIRIRPSTSPTIGVATVDTRVRSEARHTD
mgnify:CR=1 FL=1